MTIESGIVKNGKLINEINWKKDIDDIKKETRFTEKKKGKENLKKKLIEAVEKRTDKKFGILFSGGVDSSLISLICKKLNKKFTCYSVGMETADDIEWAKKVAKKLNLDLKYRIYSLEDVERVLKKTIKILKRRDIISAAVGSVVVAAMELSKEKVLFSGLGSEEIFAGYQRHAEAKDVNKECWNGLKNMWQRDFLRDYGIASYFKKEVMTPFLDKDVIKAAMQIEPKYKINKDNKKIIIREIAEDLGLSKEFAWRKKKAAQYGSNFDKAILKLAKRNGFKYKKEYLESL